MKIFREKELLKPNLFHRIFGKKQKENALIEINNLLAENQDKIRNISLDKILGIAEKYNVDVKNQNHQTRLDLFSSYLNYCLIDKKIEDNEIAELEHLKQILFLSENDTKELLKRESEEIYTNQVKDAIKAGQLDQLKKENLEKLQADLIIRDNIAQSIYQKVANEIFEKFINDKISDKRLSPDEEKELFLIAKNLGINSESTDNKLVTLDKYRIFWQIENGDLPTLMPDIVLQKYEALHFKTYTNWLEERKVTKRINYGGPVARIKIAKGFYYRVGSIDLQRVSEDVWQTIDKGTVYLTNKRLIFMGNRGNKTISINKILDFKPYKNGVSLQKDSGKSPFLEFEKNIDLFSMILNRLMRS